MLVSRPRRHLSSAEVLLHLLALAAGAVAGKARHWPGSTVSPRSMQMLVRGRCGACSATQSNVARHGTRGSTWKTGVVQRTLASWLQHSEKQTATTALADQTLTGNLNPNPLPRLLLSTRTQGMVSEARLRAVLIVRAIRAPAVLARSSYRYISKDHFHRSASGRNLCPS